METLYDANLVPRIMLTVIGLAIAIGPIVADFNKTHATNPLWTPHARFHVVWQVLCQTGVSMVILYLLWAPSSAYVTHLWLAAMLIFIWGASFFVTLASMPLFGGALKDVNGIKPFRFVIAGKVHLVDTNLFGATILMILAAIAVSLIAA